MSLEVSGGIFYHDDPMKRLFKSYFHHSATERSGIIALLLLICLLAFAAVTMRHFITPPGSLQTDTALATAWKDYKLMHSAAGNASFISSERTERILFPFDPNTLDSLGFIKLGLRPVTARFLLNWRRKGKVFYKKEEFKKLYTLTEEEYTMLAPYIIINAVPKENYDNSRYSRLYAPPPDPIDINTTDSATLIRIRGIGPFFAHKLIERRNALGGYIRYEQLMEAYKFPDSTYIMLKEKLIISPQTIRKINLNTATEEQLKTHPYIGEKTAKNILIYRDAIKQFEKTEQIRQVPLMNEENYRKIVPYLSIE